MTDATTQAALSLLERLRTLAETWEGKTPPNVTSGLSILAAFRLRDGQPPEYRRAVSALQAVNYYDARNKTEWLARLSEAIEALKGETT